MKKLISILILVFAVVFAIMIIGPGLWSSQFSGYDLIKNGDVLDVFTPIILIVLYWLLFKLGKEEPPNSKDMLVFLILAAFWVEGQGMHLSATSIGHLVEDKGSDVYQLVYFYDEHLSHYLWHFGMVGLSALLIYRQWKNPLTGQTPIHWAVILAGMIHGLNYFIVVVEAQTAALGVPFALLAILVMIIWGRKYLWDQPMLTFFFITYVVVALFFVGWAIYWGDHPALLPEFSAVGIID